MPYLRDHAPGPSADGDADLQEVLAVLCERLQANSGRVTKHDGTALVHRRFRGVPTQHRVNAEGRAAARVVRAEGGTGTGSGLTFEFHLPAAAWHPDQQRDLERAAHWVWNRYWTRAQVSGREVPLATDPECPALDALRSFDHEARSPLQAILGFAQLLQQSGQAPEQIRRLRLIEEAGRHLIALLDELQDRVYAHREQERPTEDVDLTSLVAETVALIEPLAAERDLVLDLTTTDPIEVRAVRHHTVQILFNLLTNAVKYTHPGDTVKIAVTRQGDEATVTVQDHGPGLSAATLERIFEPFYRVRRDSGHDVSGTGLGLPICRSLAEHMDGRVEAHSTPGQGATFNLRLPLKADRSPDRGAGQGTSPPSTAT